MNSSPSSAALGNPWLLMPAVTLLAYLIVILAQWQTAGGHLYGFISFNTKRVDSATAPIPARYVSDAFGYDGQFYYRFALNPFSTEEEVQGLSIDNPAWRKQRILLSLLTWVIAQGDAEATAYVMLAINLLAVAGLCIVGGLLLQRYGLPPWPALLLGMYPGFAISVERFLTEPLSFFLLLSSLLCLVDRRVLAGSLLLAAAVLARETALAVALAMSGIWLLQIFTRPPASHWRAPGPRYWLLPMLTYLGWQYWLGQQYPVGAVATAERGGLLVWPFSGLWESVKILVSNPNVMNLFFALMLTLVVAFTLLVALKFRESNGPYRWIWLAYLGLTSLLGTPIWDNSPGFLRSTTELTLLGLLIYLLVMRSLPRQMMVLWLGAWVLSAGAEAYRIFLIDQARQAVG